MLLTWPSMLPVLSFRSLPCIWLQNVQHNGFRSVTFEQVVYQDISQQPDQLDSLLLEVLGALLSVLTIWLVTGVLVYLAIERCINQNFEVKPTEMIIVASCGVVFNIV